MFSHFSIFNENISDFKLWNKKCPEFANCDEEIFFETEAWKPSTEKGTFTQRWFALKGNYLFYKKRKEAKRISGIFDLQWSTAKFDRVADKQLQQHFGFVLVIIKNSKFTRIFLKDREDMEKWREALKLNCIMGDFEDRYTLLEMVGRGAYGKVSMAEYLILNLSFNLPTNQFEILTVFQGFQN